MTPSETLRETFSHLRALTELTRLFDGKVVDVSSDSVILEMCAKPSRIDSFMKLCKPFGVLEASRTGKTLQSQRKDTETDPLFPRVWIGVMAMPRSPVHDHYEPQTDHSYEDEGVDLTLLPPG